MAAPTPPEERELKVGLYLLLRLPIEAEEATQALELPAALEVAGPTARAVVYLLHEYLKSRGEGRG